MRMDINGAAGSKILETAAPAGKNVLEIGCGDGRMTAFLGAQTRRLTAVDLEMDLLLAARRNGCDAAYLVASGECLPVKSESFDAVFFTQSLHHQDSPNALREAARVLKPAGRILVLEPVIGSELEDICGIFKDETQSRLHALYGILGAHLKIARCEFFQTRWRFKDLAELHRWLFAYYQVPYDPAIAFQVDEMLGDKSEHSPLDIGEKMVLIVLGK